MSGDRLDQPTGERIEILRSGTDTGGRVFELEAVLPPGCSGPPAHRHRDAEESFEVLDGRVSLRLGREWREVEPGETVVVPPGIVHAFANRTGHDARMRTRETPAGQLESQLRLMSRAGRVPPLLRLARLNVEHGLSFELAALPGALQRPLWRVLAVLPHR